MPKSRIPKYIMSRTVKHLPSISSSRVEGTKECYSGPFYVQFPVIYIIAHNEPQPLSSIYSLSEVF